MLHFVNKLIDSQRIFGYYSDTVYRHINEQIDVFINCTKQGLTPLCFSWRNQDYDIQEVNFVHSSTKGNTKIFHFAVSTSTENYKLVFNTKNLTWFLEEVYTPTNFERAGVLNDKDNFAY